MSMTIDETLLAGLTDSHLNDWHEERVLNYARQPTEPSPSGESS